MLISLGTFGSKLLVFFMVRFYTSYLTPADYGTADLITQTANLLFPLISLGITDGVFRFAVDHTEQRRNIFLRRRVYDPGGCAAARDHFAAAGALPAV